MRATQPHSIYYAFVQGRFDELLEKEDMMDWGDPAQVVRHLTSANKSLVERLAR